MNIVFLDIDGPMKPARLYLDNSVPKYGSGFCKTSVAAVNKLCERCDASIVFNTTWNCRREPDIMEIARNEGITANILGKTRYPMIDNRLDAIMDWIKTHPAEQVERWVALDDAPIKHENAILVNAEMGIGVENYSEATKILGNYDSFLILM